MTIKRLLSTESIDEIRRSTLYTDLTDQAFAEFQIRHLERTFPGFSYSKSTVSLIETDGNGAMINIESVLSGFDAPDDEVLASYMQVVDQDDLAAIVYANPGRLFLDSDVFEGGIREYPLFKDHAKKFGVHKGYHVGFSLIAADEYFVSFGYMGGEHSPKWHGIDPVELEYASFVFALAWLYRKKRIGRQAFESNLLALEGLTLRRMEKLRRFINSTAEEDLTAQATSLGLKLKGYDNPLYEIRDAMLARFGEDVEGLKASGTLRLEAMWKYCYLLSMMKDQTRPIVVPDGLQLTPAYYARIKNGA